MNCRTSLYECFQLACESVRAACKCATACITHIDHSRETEAIETKNRRQSTVEQKKSAMGGRRERVSARTHGPARHRRYKNMAFALHLWYSAVPIATR